VIFVSLEHQSPQALRCSQWTMTCRRLWYSGLGSSSGNSLQMGCVDPCIIGYPVYMSVVTFSDCCNTFTSEYPWMGFSNTCLILTQNAICKFYSLIRSWLKLLY
jgi:hypothetical protein